MPRQVLKGLFDYCIALIFGGAKILANSQFRHLAEF